MLVGMKDTRQARVGDTWHHYRRPVEPLPGFRPAKSMVFAGGLVPLHSVCGCVVIPWWYLWVTILHPRLSPSSFFLACGLPFVCGLRPSQLTVAEADRVASARWSACHQTLRIDLLFPPGGLTWRCAPRLTPPPSAGIFPLSAAGFEQLQAAMERLTLNDASGG